MDSTCKQCGSTIHNGKHPVGFSPIYDKECLDRLAKLACAGCGIKVSLEIIKQQGMKDWYFVHLSGKCFCPGCSHSIIKSI